MGRRILCLSDLWLPFPGGAERLMFNLTRDLQRRGHDVHVLTGYETPRRFDGPHVSRDDISLDAEGWARIQQRLDIHWPEVILTYHLYARTFHKQLAATGLPVVEVVLNGQRMPEASVAVMISEWVAARAGAHSGDLVFTPFACDDVVADTHGDAIGFVKPYPHKGAELVYAVAALMPERRFVILRGEWPTLEVLPPIELPNIEWMAPVDDMRDFYREVRLVLMPSISEDAGTVAQEATVNGLPCISSAVGGLAETNAGGVRLDPTTPYAPHWASVIRALDHPEIYADRVARQRAALPDPEPILAELSARIEAL